MKLIKIIIHHIAIPLGTILFFILAGMSSAGISALIEYCVFREMFTSEYQNLIPAATIGLILVVILEFTKIYLHFLLGRLSDKPKMQRHAKWILSFLVCISTICTIIFGVNTFYLASYNADTAHAEIAVLETQFQETTSQIELKHQQTYEVALEPYVTAKTSADNALAAFSPKGLSSRQAETKLMALKDAVTTANAEYERMQEILSTTRDTNIQNEVQILEQSLEAEIENLSNISSPEVASQYDNPVLSHFLTVLAQILFHANTYSRSVYLAITTFFSIMIAVLLEAIMSFCFKFISFPFDTLVDKTDPIGPTIQTWCNNLILTSLKTCCALFVSVIIISFTAVNMDNFRFDAAIISCGLSFLLVKHFVSKSSVKHNDRAHLIYTIRDSLVGGVISFMGYMIWGFLLGESALTIDIQTVAVGIGTTVASCFNYTPTFLVNYLDKYSTV